MQKTLYCQECGEMLTHEQGNEYHCPKCDMHYTINFCETVEEFEKETGMKIMEVPCVGTIRC